jgi:hypothetical protein
MNSVSDMKIGLRYVVTKGSDDGTFGRGDHIWASQDGSVCCQEAGGWIEAGCVAEGMLGIEFILDPVWAAREKARLISTLAALEANDSYATIERKYEYQSYGLQPDGSIRTVRND